MKKIKQDTAELARCVYDKWRFISS